MALIKTTHVGSLPRPPEMISRILRKQEITTDDYRRYLSEILQRQMSLGIGCINNGELPRLDYVRATVDRISGFDGTGTAPFPLDLEEMPELSRLFGSRNGLITLNPKAPVTLPACTRPLEYTGEGSLRSELEMMTAVFDELKPMYPGVPPDLFFTAPSPGTVALFFENKYYPTYQDYLESIAAALKHEYEMIAASGCHLQIDCPDLAMGRHTRFKSMSDDEFLSVIDTHIHVLNNALSTVDTQKCRIHICWGNYPGTHHRDIGLDKIFDRIMAVDARFISLEACNHRHAHEWAVFDELKFPEEKVLMPGVIDTRSNTVEHPELVAMRITRFANLVGADRVIASTDCGFATTATATSVSGEVAWLKLASLAEGAKLAGRRLS